MDWEKPETKRSFKEYVKKNGVDDEKCSKYEFTIYSSAVLDSARKLACSIVYNASFTFEEDSPDPLGMKSEGFKLYIPKYEDLLSLDFSQMYPEFFEELSGDSEYEDFLLLPIFDEIVDVMSLLAGFSSGKLLHEFICHNYENLDRSQVLKLIRNSSLCDRNAYDEKAFSWAYIRALNSPDQDLNTLLEEYFTTIEFDDQEYEGKKESSPSLSSVFPNLASDILPYDSQANENLDKINEKIDQDVKKFIDNVDVYKSGISRKYLNKVQEYINGLDETYRNLPDFQRFN